MKRLSLILLAVLSASPAWALTVPFQTDKTTFTEGTSGVQIVGGCVNDTRGGNISEDNVGCLRATNKGDLHTSAYDSGGTAATDTTAHAVRSLIVDSTGAAVAPSAVVTDAATITRGQSSVLLGDVALFADNGTNYARLQADGSGYLKTIFQNTTIAVTNAGTFATQAAQSGTWTVQPGNTANTTPWLTSLQPTTSGGTSACYITSAATNNATNCKASAGQIYGYEAINTTATIYYLRLYNLATSPTCSSSTGFIRTIPVPASTSGGGTQRSIDNGEAYGTGIGFCLTGGGGSTDNTSAATGVYLTINYK